MTPYFSERWLNGRLQVCIKHHQSQQTIYLRGRLSTFDIHSPWKGGMKPFGNVTLNRALTKRLGDLFWKLSGRTQLTGMTPCSSFKRHHFCWGKCTGASQKSTPEKSRFWAVFDHIWWRKQTGTGLLVLNVAAQLGLSQLKIAHMVACERDSKWKMVVSKVMSKYL